MKALWVCGLVVGGCLGISAWAVKPGDSRQAVVDELGKPMGFIGRGDEEILYYERGTVQLKDGKVLTAELISAEQLREQREAAERARVASSQAPDPQPGQQVVYAQPPAQPQVVVVPQPAPQQVIYVAPQPDPQVVYYSQPSPVVCAPQTFYTSAYPFGCSSFGYGCGYGGAFNSFQPSFQGGFAHFGAGGRFGGAFHNGGGGFRSGGVSFRGGTSGGRSFSHGGGHRR